MESKVHIPLRLHLFLWGATTFVCSIGGTLGWLFWGRVLVDAAPLRFSAILAITLLGVSWFAVSVCLLWTSLALCLTDTRVRSNPSEEFRDLPRNSARSQLSGVTVDRWTQTDRGWALEQRGNSRRRTIAFLTYCVVAPYVVFLVHIWTNEIWPPGTPWLAANIVAKSMVPASGAILAYVGWNVIRLAEKSRITFHVDLDGRVCELTDPPAGIERLEIPLDEVVAVQLCYALPGTPPDRGGKEFIEANLVRRPTCDAAKELPRPHRINVMTVYPRHRELQTAVAIAESLRVPLVNHATRDVWDRLVRGEAFERAGRPTEVPDHVE